MGRPSTYTPELAAEICERIAVGETLRAICRDDGMPAWRTVYDWITDNKDFSARIAHARELGFDAIAEQALEIADTPQTGVEIEESEKDGRKIRSSDMLGHRKLQVETRLKLLAKWCSAKYGDSASLQLTGANGGAIQLDDTQASSRLAALMAAAAARRQTQADDPAADLV